MFTTKNIGTANLEALRSVLTCSDDDHVLIEHAQKTTDLPRTVWRLYIIATCI